MQSVFYVIDVLFKMSSFLEYCTPSQNKTEINKWKISKSICNTYDMMG